MSSSNLHPVAAAREIFIQIISDPSTTSIRDRFIQRVERDLDMGRRAALANYKMFMSEQFECKNPNAHW